MEVLSFLSYIMFLILCTIWSIEGILKLVGLWVECKEKLAHKEEREEEYIPTRPNTTTEEEDAIVALKQQQMYNVEKYKERMRMMREEQDEDGLYEEKKAITLEELGYFTGVEANE